MAGHAPRQIEWGSAQIQDATLTVELTGTSSKAWSTRFEGVLALLDMPQSNWGEVSVTKKKIKVADVQQGSESELRHLLESIVLQSNSDTQSGSAEQRPEAREEPASDPDKQMTATFRSFASE